MPDRKKNQVDPGLDVLLDLHDEVFVMDKGCWAKIEAIRVDPTEGIPHGIRYSLTLHEKNNSRVIGYDNAHAIASGRKRFRANRIEWDHKHEEEKVRPYDFESADQLLNDFWDDVNKYLKNL